MPTEKIPQINHGLAGVQRVGGRRLRLKTSEDTDSNSFGPLERGDLLTNNLLTESPEDPGWGWSGWLLEE